MPCGIPVGAARQSRLQSIFPFLDKKTRRVHHDTHGRMRVREIQKINPSA